MRDPAYAVRTALRDFGLSGNIVELPEPAPTATATARQLGCEVGAIANSLVFSIGESPLLVVASGAHRVDTRLIARLIGVGRGKIRQASADFVLQATGQEIGGVAPVGHSAPIRTIVDLWLARHPRVWAGAGLPHTVFSTTFAELVKLTDGERADIGE